MYEDHRLILVTGGERAGKSFLAGLFGTTRTPWGSRFWIVGPDYALARPEFIYWTENLLRLGAIRRDSDISLPKMGPAQAVTKSGQIIETKTSDDTKKLAAYAPSGIIMAEAAQSDYDTYLRCVGRIAETRGWLLMAGTLEGSADWYADLFNEWQQDNREGGVSYSIPSWNNYFIYPGGREDPEILRLEQIYSRVPGLFEERIAAVPIPPHNLIFREYARSVHQTHRALFDPTLPVYLAIDPSDGTNPYAVYAVQFHKHEREYLHPDPIDYAYVIDEIYETGKMTEQLIHIAQEREWWDNVRGGAIDVEAPDEKKRWLKYGKVPLHSEKILIPVGIRRMRSFLHFVRHKDTGVIVQAPHLIISPRCKMLHQEFIKYKKDVPSEDGREFKDAPAPNQPDHGMKALWYLLIARYGEVKGQGLQRPVRNWHRRQ